MKLNNGLNFQVQIPLGYHVASLKNIIRFNHTSRAARLVMTSQKNHRPRAARLVRLRFLPRHLKKHRPVCAVSRHMHRPVCAYCADQCREYSTDQSVHIPQASALLARDSSDITSRFRGSLNRSVQSKCLGYRYRNKHRPGLC